MIRFAVYTTSEIPIVFRWAGQLLKIAHSRGVYLHLVLYTVPLAHESQSPKRHLSISLEKHISSVLHLPVVNTAHVGLIRLNEWH